jgi:hypothetical protein
LKICRPSSPQSSLLSAQEHSFKDWEIVMQEHHTSKFQYTRQRGEHRTYDVVLTIAQCDSGTFSYKAWVHCEHDFKGNGLNFPLTSRATTDAENEARARIERDIEQLAGVRE